MLSFSAVAQDRLLPPDAEILDNHDDTASWEVVTRDHITLQAIADLNIKYEMICVQPRIHQNCSTFVPQWVGETCLIPVSEKCRAGGSGEDDGHRDK